MIGLRYSPFISISNIAVYISIVFVQNDYNTIISSTERLLFSQHASFTTLSVFLSIKLLKCKSYIQQVPEQEIWHVDDTPAAAARVTPKVTKQVGSSKQ